MTIHRDAVARPMRRGGCLADRTPRAVLVRALLLAVVAVALVPSAVEAQPWLSDRSRTEGPGIRVGNLELHPGVGMEGGYDTNLYLAQDNEFDTWMMRVSAHLLASTIGAERQEEGEGDDDNAQVRQKLAFRGGAAVAYYHFFAASSLDSVAADLSLGATINPEGRFRLHILEEYTRTIEPFTNAPPVGVSPPSYARDRNVAGLELSAHSPGDMLVGLLSYRFDVDLFEDGDFRYASSMTHEVVEQLSWKVFPRTALVQQARVRFRSYPSGEGGASLVSDGAWVEVRAGVNGAITQKLSTSVLVGYSAGFFDTSDDFEGFNLRLETRYRPRPTIDLRLGYAHAFEPSFVGNYAESDQIDFRAQFLGFGALLVGMDGMLSFDESGLAVAGDGTLLGNTEIREDVRVHLSLFAEYRFTDWLGVDLTVTYTGDFTDYSFNDPGMGTSVIPDPGGAYNKVETWLGVRAFY